MCALKHKAQIANFCPGTLVAFRKIATRSFILFFSLINRKPRFVTAVCLNHGLEAAALCIVSLAPSNSGRDRDPLVAGAGVGYTLDYTHVTHPVFEVRIRALSAA